MGKVVTKKVEAKAAPAAKVEAKAAPKGRVVKKKLNGVKVTPPAVQPPATPEAKARFTQAAADKGVTVAATQAAAAQATWQQATCNVMAYTADGKQIGSTKVPGPEVSAACERFRHLAGVASLTIVRHGGEASIIEIKPGDEALNIPPALIRPLTPDEIAKAAAAANITTRKREWATPSTPAPAAKAAPAKTLPDGTKIVVEHKHPQHREGSRKGAVRHLYDTKGPDAAREYALAQGLKGTTVTSWFSTWRRAGGASA